VISGRGECGWIADSLTEPIVHGLFRLTLGFVSGNAGLGEPLMRRRLELRPLLWSEQARDGHPDNRTSYPTEQEFYETAHHCCLSVCRYRRKR
jgi:hypothetical protein